MRPSERMSPISVTPVTSAENSSGTISMKISDRNSWPKGLVIPCTITSTTGAQYHAGPPDRKSVVPGKGLSERVDRGGRRLITKQHNINDHQMTEHHPT